MRNSRPGSGFTFSSWSWAKDRRPIGSIALVLALAGAAPLRADLNAIRQEPKPEKRAELALVNASAALTAAEDAYKVKGDLGATDAALKEVGASVDLAFESLQATHKNPSKSPKHFKRAEIKTRELLRRLTDFRDQMGFDERDVLDKVRASVQKVHENLLEGIMGGKKI